MSLSNFCSSALICSAATLGVGCSTGPLPTGGGGCTLVGCESMFVLTTALPVPFESVHTLQAELCKNGACLRGSLARITDMPEPRSGIGTEFPDPPVDGAARGRVVVRDDGDSRLTLVATYIAYRDTDLQDGDTMRVALTDGTNTPFSFERAVSFKEVSPNGPLCGPTCRQAEVDLAVDGGVR